MFGGGMAFALRRPPSLSPKCEAYPYQLDAVRAVQDLPYAAIFHEQGLGKTKIAVDLLLRWLAEDIVDTVFVVTKKTLVQNWVNELASHSYITPRVLSGNRRDNSISLNSPVLLYVMNYEVVSTNQELMHEFLATCRVAVILDESQKIKNPESSLSACFHSLAPKFARRVIMTGTPVANRPYDIWSQIKFLDDGKAFGASFVEFKDRLDLPHDPAGSAEYSSAPSSVAECRSSPSRVAEYGSALSRVMDTIRNFSVRETKATAGIELPDKTILTRWANLASRQAGIYSSYRDKMAYELRSNGRYIVDDAEALLKRLLRLVQCASNPLLVDKTYSEAPGKYRKLLELLEEIDLRDNKVIVWTRFIENVEWLGKKLSQHAPQKVHGQMDVDARNISIGNFKENSNCRILLATPGAAKEGLTLTVANHAIFYDRGFSLDDYLQAQDRIHRISQTRDCFVHNLIARNTIDEWVDTLLNAKYQAAQLAQGDISKEKFDAEFSRGLSEALEQILCPAKENHNSQREMEG